jgi:hypothetical protein
MNQTWQRQFTTAMSACYTDGGLRDSRQTEEQKMDDKLQELINLQKEHNELLRKYLWRFRFSLMSLLVLTTVTAVGLGFLVYQNQSKVTPPIPPTAVWSYAPSQGTLTFDTDTTALFDSIAPPQANPPLEQK